MEDPRLTVNEDMVDELAARVDDLERRFERLRGLLGSDSACRALGLSQSDLDLAAPSPSPLEIRTFNRRSDRLSAIRDLEREAVLDRLTRVTPEKLDELLR